MSPTNLALQELSENTDHYPSRVANRAARLPRYDPVVYGDATHGPLSSKQLTTYDQQGFLHFDALFSPEEVEELTQEVTLLKLNRAGIDPDYIISEPGSGDIRSFFHVHAYNPIFKALASHPRIVRMAEQILGSMVYLHQSRVNLKPAFSGKEFYWHSDFETWHAEDGMPRMRALSCTISLTENTEQNGPLLVIPGSHKEFVQCVGETPDNHYKASLRRQQYGVPDPQTITDMAQAHNIVSLPGAVGSVTLFDCNLLHGSNGNITPFPRNNVFFVYNSILNILRAPYCAQPPRPEHIATRDRCETV